MIYRLVHNVALVAALTVLVASLWHDLSLLTTVKRMLISYLGFFFLGAVMALTVKFVGTDDSRTDDSADS